MSLSIRHLLVPGFLAACLLLGGASAAGFLANLVLQLAALVIIGWGLWNLSWERLSTPSRTLLILAAALCLVLVVQLVPLPPAIWTRLPGRQPVVAGYALMQVPLPWLPISLAPKASVASALWLLPAFAVLFGMVVLGAFRSRWVCWAMLGATALGIGLGTLQVVGGSDNGAYLYRFTNWGQAVGFFANSNHMATLLVICIPFLFALRQSLLKDARTQQRASAVHLLIWASVAVLAVGLLTNRSQAGLGLGLPVILLSVLAFRSKPLARGRIVAATIALVGLAGFAVFFSGFADNNLFGEQTAYHELSRQTSFRLTTKAAGEYFPIGSGVGSFQPVYRTQEALPDVTSTYMNHAHSDWLEILLETGIVGLLIVAAFLVWWGMRAAAIWRADVPDHYAKAATIATAAILLHSIVDYPLRTAAISAVFALCVGLMADVRPFAKRTRRATNLKEVKL